MVIRFVGDIGDGHDSNISADHVCHADGVFTGLSTHRLWFSHQLGELFTGLQLERENGGDVKNKHVLAFARSRALLLQTQERVLASISNFDLKDKIQERVGWK